MRQQCIQHNQGAFLYFERPQIIVGPRRIIDDFEACAAFLTAKKPRLQSQLVTSGNRPQASVVDGGVFQRKPETNYPQRLGVKKGRVLMTSNFAADARL